MKFEILWSMGSMNFAIWSLGGFYDGKSNFIETAIGW